MDRRRKTSFFFLTVVFLTGYCAPLYSQTDYFSANNIFKFAEHLYEEGDYIRAAGEYERNLYMKDSYDPPEQLIYRIGLCYQLGAETDKARRYYLTLTSESSAGSFKERALFQIADTYYDDGGYDECVRYLEDTRPMFLQQSSRVRADQLSVLCFLHLHRWEEANTRLTLIMPDNPEYSLNTITMKLGDYATAGTALPYKSPKVAGTLSALLPGSGKVYVGRTKDGIISFLTISLFSLMSYNGFNDDGSDSVKGWVFGTLSVVFYAANVYGSVNAARIHNVLIEDQLTESINVDLTWR